MDTGRLSKAPCITEEFSWGIQTVWNTEHQKGSRLAESLNTINPYEEVKLMKVYAWKKIDLGDGKTGQKLEVGNTGEFK